MKPLLSGPVVTRPGTKFPAVFVFVVNGNRFSNVDEAGDTVHVAVFKPANWALKGEIGFAGSLLAKCVGFSLLHASTMLKVGSPIATSAGIVSTTGFVSVVRNPS